MKKLIALTALLSMSVAFADDVVYGTFVLNSSEPEVVLCVPWVNPGSTDGSIPVTDLIQTSTLVDGDQLFYYNKGYKTWVVKDSKWQAIQVQNENGLSSDEPPLVRGNAVILKRNMTTNTSRSKDIIINGQVGTSPAGAITMARGGTDDKGNLTPAYTLIAPANPDTLTSLNAGGWIGVQENDCIIVNLKSYYYNGTKWGVRGAYEKDENGKLKRDSTGNFIRTWNTEDVCIPAGCGAWYVANGPCESGTTWEPTTK